MSEQELLRICVMVRNGAKLYVGSTPSGRRKIKLVRGPFGLLTKRIDCSESDIQKLRALLSNAGNKAA